jgi:hypothetical protein
MSKCPNSDFLGVLSVGSYAGHPRGGPRGYNAQCELYIAELERKVVRRTAFRMAGEEVVCDKTDHDTQADEMRRWCWRARAVRLTKGSVAQNGTATLGSTGSTDSVIGLVLG